MFGFKKKKEMMLNTSIGKISRDTLKSNPDMITREFKRKIDKVDKGIKDLFSGLKDAVDDYCVGRYGILKLIPNEYRQTVHTKKSKVKSKELTKLLFGNMKKKDLADVEEAIALTKELKELLKISEGEKHD